MGYTYLKGTLPSNCPPDRWSFEGPFLSAKTNFQGLHLLWHQCETEETGGPRSEIRELFSFAEVERNIFIHMCECKYNINIYTRTKPGCDMYTIDRRDGVQVCSSFSSLHLLSFCSVKLPGLSRHLECGRDVERGHGDGMDRNLPKSPLRLCGDPKFLEDHPRTDVSGDRITPIYKPQTASWKGNVAILRGLTTNHGY